MTPLDLAKLVGGPGSIRFLVAASIAGLLLVRASPRTRSYGRAWLLALYLTYIVLSLPAVALAIAAPFNGESVGRPVGTHRTDTLIVFDGDNRRGRVAETMRLWWGSRPERVIVSGEAWLVDHLAEAGMPRARIEQEEESATTRDQIDFVRRYQAAHPHARLAIVASRLQTPRIAALLHHAGVRADVFAAPVDREPPMAGLFHYLPTYAALRVSRDALYERLALVYYARRGWIAPARR